MVVPQTQDLKFTYILSGAEVISINRSKVGDDFVIGVTIIKSAERGFPEQYTLTSILTEDSLSKSL